MVINQTCSSIILIVLKKQKTVETWGETEINREESVTFLPYLSRPTPSPSVICCRFYVAILIRKQETGNRMS